MSDRRLSEKLARLREQLGAMDRVAIAFSGGVDSTFLLKVAHDVLGDRVIAVTARSASFPERELKETIAFAAAIGVRHLLIDSEELNIDGFSDNPVNRCYLCKRELFSKMITCASENGISRVAEGSNTDDDGDYRPGRQAILELGIVTPLRDAGLGKAEIRALSKELGLPTWDKPAFACLASRIPYGVPITREKLHRIDVLEQYLLNLGFRQVRVRDHGELARIEVGGNERLRLCDPSLMDQLHETFRAQGFTYVTMDLRGYRTGSMNEPLNATGAAATSDG